MIMLQRFVLQIIEHQAQAGENQHDQQDLPGDGVVHDFAALHTQP